jgi:Asp-tRNA(Asn)/Glu-tRNA(Gln) amidotransferase A subunit family amidase
MTITTEEAEWLADWVEDEGGLSLKAAGLRSLAAERDALKVERDSWITRYNIQVDYRFRAEAEFSHMQRRIARQRRALAKLYQRRHDKKAENARLREALRLAIDAVEFWAAYATPYFQDKHDLEEDLRKLRAALGETP